ncbi:MAG TPA: hypothetical protein VGQ55_07075 [Pyrinomonadaceae bacterium]|nr:hypothetical protein [Pyrinomonadaceae bacterium]
MKFLVVLSLFAMLALFSCSKGSVKELDAFIGAKDEILSAWAKELDTNPTEAGVDNMRKSFESKKADLIAKREAVEKAGVSGNSLNRLLDSEEMDRKMLDAMGSKLSSAPSAAGEKFRALRRDYETAVKRPGTI